MLIYNECLKGKTYEFIFFIDYRIKFTIFDLMNTFLTLNVHILKHTCRNNIKIWSLLT